MSLINSPRFPTTGGLFGLVTRPVITPPRLSSKSIFPIFSPSLTMRLRTVSGPSVIRPKPGADALILYRPAATPAIRYLPFRSVRALRIEFGFCGPVRLSGRMDTVTPFTGFPLNVARPETIEPRGFVFLGWDWADNSTPKHRSCSRISGVTWNLYTLPPEMKFDFADLRQV